MKTKICNKCGVEKPVSEFSIHSANKDGIRNVCKKCVNDYQYIRRKTKEGLVSCIYSDQRHNSKDRGYGMPVYTNKELREWLFNQEKFHELYDLWVASGYSKNAVPSCDRIDDYKGYSLDNIRITTWHENQFRYFEDSYNGINNKQNVAILQYDKKWNFIKEYYSVSNASRSIGVKNPVTARKNISMAAHGVNPSAYGYIWVLKE